MVIFIDICLIGLLLRFDLNFVLNVLSRLVGVIGYSFVLNIESLKNFIYMQFILSEFVLIYIKLYGYVVGIYIN